MKTLELILSAYINEEYGMNKMVEIVNEAMEYKGYKIENGKRYLKAVCFGKLIEVSL